jgi:methylenetetrahydrofolate dehydrogenase (NADP+)/methenyltetrahydrofolate cyclohydrolase
MVINRGRAGAESGAMIRAMSAQIIDGKALAQRFREQVSARAKALREAGFRPKLDALLVESGDNGARVYAQNQARTCEAIGIDYELHTLPKGSDQKVIEGRLRTLNTDDDVHAIMVHMPMPDGVDAYRIQELINADKDVEGVNPANIGNVVYGRSMRAPCTALATLKLIDSTEIDLKGKRCVVVGASAVVGRPIAVLLMQREATVISCNKYTQGLKELCLGADVLIPAAGVPGLITGDMVRAGALVVDVGVNRIASPEGGTITVGDVDFEGVEPIAGYISPVPGGVGPMTVAVLLHNVIEVAEDRARSR